MSEIRVWDDEGLIAVLLHMQGAIKYPAGIQVASGERGIRSGDILAKDTSKTGDYAVVCKVTQLAAAASSGATTITVDDAHPFQVGDSIVVASQSARTIGSINYGNNQLTITSGLASNASNNTTVVARANDKDHPIAIANTPVLDKDSSRSGNLSDLVTPIDRTIAYGDAYVVGTFKADVIQNGNFQNGNLVDTAFAGRYNAHNKTYVISSFPANYEEV